MYVLLMQRRINEMLRDLFGQLGMTLPTATEDDKRWEETLALQRKDDKVRGVRSGAAHPMILLDLETTRALRDIDHEEPFSRAAAARAVSNAERHAPQMPKISSAHAVLYLGGSNFRTNVNTK